MHPISLLEKKKGKIMDERWERRKKKGKKKLEKKRKGETKKNQDEGSLLPFDRQVDPSRLSLLLIL